MCLDCTPYRTNDQYPHYYEEYLPFIHSLRRVIHSVSKKKSPVSQGYLGHVVEYLATRRFPSSSEGPSSCGALLRAPSSSGNLLGAKYSSSSA